MEKQKKGKKGQIATLLTVLTGFVIVSVIMILIILLVYTFGTVHLGLESTAISNPISNESGWINSSGYPLTGTSSTGEPRTFSLSEVYNVSTGGILLPSTNYTVSSTGIVTNATATVYTNANFTYTFLNNSASQTASRDAQTNTSRALPLVGILLIVLTIGSVITILIISLIGRRRS